MANRHMKRCSSSLIIREMQINTVLSPYKSQNGHHQTNSTNNKRRRGCAEKGALRDCCREYKPVHSLWKTVQRFLKKLKIEVPYDSTIPLLGIHLEKMETLIWKGACTSVFTAVLFTKATYMSINKWMDKQDEVHIFNRVLVIKRIKHCHFQQHAWT